MQAQGSEGVGWKRKRKRGAAAAAEEEAAAAAKGGQEEEEGALHLTGCYSMVRVAAQAPARPFPRRVGKSESRRVFEDALQRHPPHREKSQPPTRRDT